MKLVTYYKEKMIMKIKCLLICTLKYLRYYVYNIKYFYIKTDNKILRDW